ncbi:putative nuclease HARBI1 [Bufo bufo]|uniref:putative nuclease HARBI1 n=1 Tax=Bufo bufo TaxID=8384 RepID=UPI001ABEAA9A|nr:putative nuclease HARBI1 [Bufo bufo]XP_040282898.1 putative nuclease HARBI1 [Bufo bufo]
MEAFGPVMLYLLQVEEDEKKDKANLKHRRHLRPSPSSQKPHPKPKRPPSQKPQVISIRRPRIFRERTGMEGLTDEEVMERFRLSKRTIIDLYELIRADIDPLTQRSHAIPGIVKLLNCLHFFCSGSFQTKASAIGGVSQSTFSRFLVPVIQALKKHVHTFICFPTDKAGWQQLKNGFYSVAGIPHVMGVLDCIHIALSAPHEREEIYRNKKGYHSVNVQMIVDSNCRILSLFSAFPGSSQNSSILRQSSVYEGFESGRLSGGWLIGGSGYACRPWLMTPVPEPLTPAELSYNEAHASTRAIIDKTFKMLKSHFKCLDKSGGGLQYDPTKVSDIIVACCILHNISILHNMSPKTEEPSEEKLGAAYDPPAAGNAHNIRSQIIKDHFS